MGALALRLRELVTRRAHHPGPDRPVSDGQPSLLDSRIVSAFCLRAIRAESLQKARNPMGEIIDKAKGKIKQVTGTLTGNDKLKAEGEVDELKGKVKGTVEDVKQAIKGAAK